MAKYKNPDEQREELHDRGYEKSGRLCQWCGQEMLAKAITQPPDGEDAGYMFQCPGCYTVFWDTD